MTGQADGDFRRIPADEVRRRARSISLLDACREMGDEKREPFVPAFGEVVHRP